MNATIRTWMFVALVVLIAFLVGSVMTPFIGALLWATALSILTAPIYTKLRDRWKSGRLSKSADTLAALAACTITVVVFLLPFIAVGAGLFAQVQGMQSELPVAGQQKAGFETALENLDKQLEGAKTSIGAKNFSLLDTWTQNKDEILASLRSPVTSLLKNVGLTLFTLGVAILTQFFMLRDGHLLREPALDLIPLKRSTTERLFVRLVDTVWAVFYGTVLVAMLQGALIAGAYAYVGLSNWLVLGVLSFVMAIIPLLGAPTVYFPVALILLLQGNTQGALIIALFGSAFVSNIDNVIKPFLIGGRSHLHPLPIFFSILGGVLFFGPIGVMAGPMTLTLSLVVVEALRERTREAAAETVPDAS